MVFLCWAKPSLQEQKDCLNKSDGFNYDSKYRGATSKHASSLNELSKDGFLINHARVLVGSGVETYEKGKLALENWRHFGFDWGFVDSKTPIRSGVKFCVCVKEFLPWVMMPLQIVYVNESRSSKKDMASFCFGGGTLQGHLLEPEFGIHHFIELRHLACNEAGEERFSIEMDEKNQVWYEVLSFSKPAHFLSFIGYPYVRLRQKFFAHQSSNAVVKHVSGS
ncbi:hypothetical protein NC653_013524 [Populus alba x Populus x berolinensis]|uniref:DUF1990 domain-containing protein n=1 Tax=Populus alba x Populus x berolinensis TaxID=444605 RepID=A0AAD6W2Q7_9ROSI|nr:hypothetical protein NC653_013524 [Populus alba x Populus x berolinensis]